MRKVGWALLLGALVLARPAQAALTDSEKAQISGFIRSGEPKNAARIRALVARPDLAVDEAAAPLSAGFAAVPFDDKREKLARELLLGPGSAASRSELTPALVRALLARASSAYAAMPASESGPEASKADRLAAEAVRIHRFVTEVIANAGRPPADGHDAAAGIRDDALKLCVEAYRAHFERHAAILRPGSKLSPSLVPVRAQASLAAVDLSRGLLQRHEVSALLGLGGVRKSAFERHGTLVEDGGTAADERLAEVIRFLDLAPRAASELGLWLVSKAPVRGLGSRAARAGARVSLGGGRGAPVSGALWPDDVEPSRPDRELTEVAYSAAWFITRAAFKAKPELSKTAAQIATRAGRAGALGQLAADLDASVLQAPGSSGPGSQASSPELFAVHALRLILLDAPRALELALSRAVQGRDEPLAAFVLGASLLAATGGSADEVIVGRTDAGGAVGADKLTGVSLTNAMVSAFELDSKKVEVKLGADGQVDKVQVDGAAPRLSKLRRVRFLPKPGEAWQAGARRWEKISGAPRGLAIDDGRFVLGAAESSDGFDAVVTGDAETDGTVHARLSVKGRGGGLLVRAQAGQKSYDGIALVVTLEPTPKATLVLVDGKAKATELAAPVELPAPGEGGYLAVLSVKGQTVTASVDGKKLQAKLTRGVGSGRAGLVVPAAGVVEVSGFDRGAPPAAKKGAAEQKKGPTETKKGPTETKKGATDKPKPATKGAPAGKPGTPPKPAAAPPAPAKAAPKKKP
ncbi:MAG: hypothetical protein HYZ29_04260 [Myxococcales bacterium]|nr:hypothetical protein [Myxococcales bacterium]